MGRAIVRKPQVFLMDEPLSNLDAKLRVQTRTQIASLQRRLGVTTVYVTHDQVEAMTMGDRVAVLKDGLLQQVGSPRGLYDHPDNVFVAGFIGSPAMNLLQLPATPHGVRFGDIDYPVERGVLSGTGDRVIFGVRPEDLDVSDRGLAIEVEVVEELGADAYIYGRTLRGADGDVAGGPGQAVDAEGHLEIIARTDGRRPPQKGETVRLAPKQGTVHLFHSQDGKRLETTGAPVSGS
jgi:multiple sugar transport system ATP-binding protein